MPETISFGIWLRKQRRSLDLTQKALAELVGCAEITIRRMESDSYKPSRELALVLFEKLGISNSEQERWFRIARGLPDGSNETNHLPVQDQRLTNLPTTLTTFIGREKEIKEIKQAIFEHRLVTLIGPGGIGKTRLSLHLASENLGDFPDGVWFVPLASLESAETLVPAIATAIGLSLYHDERDVRQQFLDYIRDKKLILILDNFEHLLVGGTDLVLEILAITTKTKLLITSRESLNIQIELLYRVSGMYIPDISAIQKDIPEIQAGGGNAIQLLAERARRVQPGFRVTQDNVAAVLRICTLVDGSPLGIELASAWLGIMTLDEIVKEINSSLDFLEADLKDIPVRQRSIRSVFVSSQNLLNNHERNVFQMLTVFQGSFSHEALQYVSNTTPKILLGLTNKSMVQPVGNGRFQIHEVLRQYGFEQLRTNEKKWELAKERHAEYYLQFVETQGQALCDTRQIKALDSLNTEFRNNICNAWDWLVDNKRYEQLITKMLPGLFHFVMIRNWSSEFLSMLERAWKPVPELSSREQLLHRVILETVFCFFAGSIPVGKEDRRQLMRLWKIVQQHDLALEMGIWFFVLISAVETGLGFDKDILDIRESVLTKLRTQNDLWSVGYALLVSSSVSEPEQSEKFLLEALVVFQKLGVIHEQGGVLQKLGDIARFKNSFDQALEYKLASKDCFEQAGDLLRAGLIWHQVASINCSRGHFEDTYIAYRQARKIFEGIGNRRLVGTNLNFEGETASRYGTLEHALESFQLALVVSEEAGNQSDIAWNLWNLGEIYRLMGNLGEAQRLYQGALSTFERLQDFNGMGFYHRGLAIIALGLKHWEDACGQYQKSLDFLEREHRYMKLWSLAYTQAGMGRALVSLGKYAEAEQVLKGAIQNALDYADGIKFVPLLGFAHLFAATGKSEQAVRLAALIVNHRLSWNETKCEARSLLDLTLQNLSKDFADGIEIGSYEMTLDEAVKLTLNQS